VTNADATVDANGDGVANADDVGYWEFTDLNYTVDGYTVREVLPDGSYLTLGGENDDDSYTIVGTSGNDQTDLDFANTRYGQITVTKYIDGDGDLDAVVANDNQANRVWLNNGSGTFSASGNDLGDSVSLGVSLGDVDGDGDLDAVVANYNQVNRVWLNDGSGTFSASGNSLGSSLSRFLSLGDVDGDGDLDIFVANQSEPNRVWFNDDEVSITIDTPNGNKIVLSEDTGGILVEDENGNKMEMGSSGIDLESGGDINIKASGNVKIEGTDIALAANASFKAEGGAGANLESSATTVVKGSLVQIN